LLLRGEWRLLQHLFNNLHFVFLAIIINYEPLLFLDSELGIPSDAGGRLPIAM
jgi:hypothetical protein